MRDTAYASYLKCVYTWDYIYGVCNFAVNILGLLQNFMLTNCRS